ncbi:TIGR01777 family oxidoreductase [Spongiibacter sp.]|uniref:TIGR01777 family oxidoreductase n=1 Tax=Spongiibacter sp. TaxID=2024860 RepID=UPI0035696D11
MSDSQRVAVSGASGFIGRALCASLLERGHQVLALGRDKSALQRGFASLPAGLSSHDYSELAALNPTAVINLAGENIAARRWRPAQKQRLLDSRLNTTRRLCEAAEHWPALHSFISASAIGYYGDGGDSPLNESAAAGSGFAAELCQRWEDSVQCQARRVIARLAVVLDRERDAGALAKMRLPFSLGLGARFGSGQQWQAYIHRRDAVRALIFLLETPALSGTFNLSCPEPLRNRQFSEQLAAKLHRPLLLSIPETAAALLFGEMRELFYQSQRVVPTALLNAAFQFDFASVDSALDDALQAVQQTP